MNDSVKPIVKKWMEDNPLESDWVMTQYREIKNHDELERNRRHLFLAGIVHDTLMYSGFLPESAQYRRRTAEEILEVLEEKSDESRSSQDS